MAGLPGGTDWPTSIYQIEQTDPVVGGPPNEDTGAGLVNTPHWQLERRTNWLKQRVDNLIATVVAATTSVAGIVRLTDSVTSTSTTTAATPKSVKAAYDNAEMRVPQGRRISTEGLASGGGQLIDSLTINVPVATQAEAQQGTANNRASTPLRVFEGIKAYLSSRAPGDLHSIVMAKNLSASTVNTGQEIQGANIRSSSADGESVGIYYTGQWRAMSVVGPDKVGLFMRIG